MKAINKSKCFFSSLKWFINGVNWFLKLMYNINQRDALEKCRYLNYLQTIWYVLISIKNYAETNFNLSVYPFLFLVAEEWQKLKIKLFLLVESISYTRLVFSFLFIQTIDLWSIHFKALVALSLGGADVSFKEVWCIFYHFTGNIKTQNPYLLKHCTRLYLRDSSIKTDIYKSCS